MTNHHRAKRDPQGRFTRATPAERVAAHVERINGMHGVQVEYMTYIENGKVLARWPVEMVQAEQTPKSVKPLPLTTPILGWLLVVAITLFAIWEMLR